MGEYEMTALESTSYESLINSEIIRLCINLDLFQQGEPLTCEEIGDGNLNLVFRVIHDLTKVSYIVTITNYPHTRGSCWRELAINVRSRTNRKGCT